MTKNVADHAHRRAVCGTLGRVLMGLAAGPGLVALYFMFVPDSVKRAAWAPDFMGVKAADVTGVFGTLAVIMLLVGVVMVAVSVSHPEDGS